MKIKPKKTKREMFKVIFTTALRVITYISAIIMFAGVITHSGNMLAAGLLMYMVAFLGAQIDL